MDRHDEEKVYCADENEYRIHCDVCDKFAIIKSHNNHLKTQTLISNLYRKQQLIKTITNILYIYNHFFKKCSFLL